MLVLAIMCVLGVTKSVRVHCALGIVGKLGSVSLGGQLCCSQEDISKESMTLGGLNCVGKEVFFLFLQTMSLGGLSFNVIT